MTSRRPTALLAVVALVPVLAACGAGAEATSTIPYAPSDGVQAIVGDLRVLNALVVAPPEGSTTAVLSMSVVTGRSAETLEQVTVSDATARVQGSRVIRAGSALRFGEPGGANQILLDDFEGPDGGNVSLTLLFDKAGEVVLQPPILAPTGVYEELTAEGLGAGTPAPTATLAPSPGATPGEPATGVDEGGSTPSPAAS